MSTARYLLGDVRKVLPTLADGSVDLLLTSSPFLALRSYLPEDHPGKADEIGQEDSPGEFIGTLLEVVALARPKIAPHGSVVFELGDTYAGSGGPGGDDLKPESIGFKRYGDGARYGDDFVTVAQRAAAGADWPLDKSLCGIPAAFELSLSYGRNVLTGELSPAGRWIVRNMVAWCRPNPPVGELFDKFRPGTSYLIVATLSPTRWWDVDAVRDGSVDAAKNAQYENRLGKADGRDVERGKVGLSSANGFTGLNQGGTPPLDWWAISPEAYKGSHYATWPRSLCLKPILTMCPERVCTTCGEPSRRIVNSDRTIGEADVGNGAGRARGGSEGGDLSASYSVERELVGWTECGCGVGCRATEQRRVMVPVTNENTGEPVLKADGRPRMKRRNLVGDVGHCADPSHWRRGVVLDPFAGSGTTLAVATGCGRDAIGIDLDERNLDLARERIGMFLIVDDLQLEDAPAVVA